MKFKYALVVAIISSLTLIGPPAMAARPSHGHATRHDRRGDAPAAIDITSVRMHANHRGVRVRIHVRNLRRIPHTGFTIGSLAKHPSWYNAISAINIRVNKHRRVRADVWGAYSEWRINPCKRLRVRWNTKKNTITLTSPRVFDCYDGTPRWEGRRFRVSSWKGSRFDHTKVFKLH